MKKIVTDERVRQEENQVFAWVGRTFCPSHFSSRAWS